MRFAPVRLTVVGALVLTSAAEAADFKAAYVDFQRALVEVDEGRAAKTRLQAKADARKKELEAEKTSLEKEAEAFKKQESTMDDKARREKFDGLMKRQNELAEKLQKAQMEMAEAERKEMSTILPKFELILSEISTREGLSMVFDRGSSGMAWAAPALDLTNELIRTYNARKAAGSKSEAKPETKTEAGKK
jgi:outer membrane protein